MSKHKKQINKLPAKGNIRIIAGYHRGRKLPVLMAEGLRPTTDRVKETVFNWLMPYISHADCLDCFAGSGGLGFEAISRGAKHVTMLELNKAAAKQLLQNAQLLKASNTSIVNTDTLTFLQKVPTPFNLVFLDPPFRKNFVGQVTTLLNKGWLTEKALIYVEMEANDCGGPQNVPCNWKLLREKIAGQVAYRLFQLN